MTRNPPATVPAGALSPTAGPFPELARLPANNLAGAQYQRIELGTPDSPVYITAERPFVKPCSGKTGKLPPLRKWRKIEA